TFGAGRVDQGRRGERWVRRPLPEPAPHELQGPILSFRTLPSATACSRGVGEPGTGAEVVQDQLFTGTGRACGRKKQTLSCFLGTTPAAAEAGRVRRPPPEPACTRPTFHRYWTGVR